MCFSVLLRSVSLKNVVNLWKKSMAPAMEKEVLTKEIVKEVEYIFSDINLSADGYLQDKIKENEGWIAVRTLINRHKQLSGLSKDVSEVVEAVSGSTNQVVEVNEARDKFRRHPDKPFKKLTEEEELEITRRTAHITGFGEDDNPYEVSQLLESFGEIEYCQKRYSDSKPYCFVTFKSREDCEKMMEAESLSFKELNLEKRWKEDFMNERNVKYQEQQEIKRKLQLEEREAKRAKIEAFKDSTNFAKGTILAFCGVKPDQILTREHILETIREILQTTKTNLFINYECMNAAGYIRFVKENEAVYFYRRLKRGILWVNDVKLQCRVLSGEFEEEYLSITAEEMYHQKHRQGSGRFGRVFVENSSPKRV